MTKVGRAVEKGESKGFLKILVDTESHAILGAAFLGVECDEVIHCVLDTMYAKGTSLTLLNAMAHSPHRVRARYHSAARFEAAIMAD